MPDEKNAADKSANKGQDANKRQGQDTRHDQGHSTSDRKSHESKGHEKGDDKDHAQGHDKAKQKWFAGASVDIPDGGRLVIDAGEKSVGLFRIDGKLYAYENECRHNGGPVCQGLIVPRVIDIYDEEKGLTGSTFDESDPHIVCPWHGFEYSIKTGKHAGKSSIGLKVVAVEELEGAIYVSL